MTYQGARPEPQNIDAEKGLLGIIMERNDALFDVVHLVGKADFFEPLHGELFTLMRDQIEQNRTASPTTLLHDTGQDADIGGIMSSAYLATLLKDAPPTSVARDLARAIRDLAMRRRLIQASQKVMDEAYSAPATITAAEMESRYMAQVSGMLSALEDIGVRHFADVADTMLNNVADAARKQVPLGIDLGLAGLQDLTGPILPGKLYVVAAAGGSGKTALALQLAMHVGIAEPVLFFSAEMDPEELATRHMTKNAGVDGDRIERATITQDDWGAMQDALKKLRGLKVYVDGTTAPTVGAIRGKCIRIKRKHGLALVIVDHVLELARDPKLSEFDGIRQIVQGLKRIAKDLGVAVLVLAHLKQSYLSLDKVRDPNDGDVYGGGALGQVADVEIILHNEEYMLGRRRPADDDKGAGEFYQRLDKAKGKIKFILGKRRGGKGFGERTVGYDPSTHTFTDRIDRNAPGVTGADQRPAPPALSDDEIPF